MLMETYRKNTIKMDQRTNIKPYLMLAFYTWAMDSRIVPILEVRKHPNNNIPEELKQKEQVLFSIHPNAVNNLNFGKLQIEFQAQFKGKSFQVKIPHEAISKIFNKENGNGLEFNDAIQVNQIFQTENQDNPSVEIPNDNLANSSKKVKKSNLILIKK